MIKFATKGKDDITLIGLGFQNGNFQRMDDGNDPVVVIGEQINVPKTDLLFFGGETDDEITERMQPLLEAALGEGNNQRLAAGKIAGQYFVLPVATTTGRMAYFFGFNRQVMAWMKSGGIQDIRIRPCDKDGKPLPGGVRIVPFYTDNPIKTEQQMIMAGLIGPGTQWTRQEDTEANPSEQIRKWKASLN